MATDAGTRVDARPFPRAFEAGGTAFSIHQPQYESWQDDRLAGVFAVSVATGTERGPDGSTHEGQDYGVVHFNARTQIDKAARAVVMSGLQFGAASFPTAPARQQAYLTLVEGLFAPDTTLTVSLDQLESSLAIAALDAGTASRPVANTPPEILFRAAPAVLVSIDGEPTLRATGTAGVERVINTRSLVLRQDGRFYIALAGQWMGAGSLAGPWSPVQPTPALRQAAGEASAVKVVDTMEGAPDALKQALAAGDPVLEVRTHAAELVTTEGEPVFVEVPGTALSYVGNTGADVFVDASAGYAWYVLLSGRWFTAAGSQGPWRHVEASALPADFARIPPDSPKSAVLASIPGTPEARESLIANSIPQTATVDRTTATLVVTYDGEPRFRPIDGTALQYAWNTPVPVIRTSDGGYYAVDKGIWFTAAAANGPWQVATSVPAEIYAIPTSSPLHYVTYVRVYGQDGDEVYVGYTPGYYGTVVSNNVVVYGTGYGCDPWLGAYWYGCPATYGMGVYFGWNPWVGWTFGFGFGWWGGWYGPYSPWWGPWYGPVYPWGWWEGGAAAWNVYDHWGNATVRGTAAAWANPWTGNYGRAGRGGYYNEATGGRGYGQAARNTNAYTGTTRTRASGIRYNPQTGRVVSGEVAAASNPYSGRAGVAGDRTVVNTTTGRVTDSAGAAARGDAGAAGVGGFDSDGRQVDAKGAGGFHYNADTGDLHHGGAVQVNDNVYAGHDGNVYRYQDGQWQQVTRPDRTTNPGGATRQLDRDRVARERGQQRVDGHFPQQARPATRPMPVHAPVNRPMHVPSRPTGGFRPGLGGGRPMRRGGFRR